MKEHLISAAIRRNEIVESGFKSHWEIRAALGDSSPSQNNPDDDEGFLTNTGRFVTREEAREVAVKCGQLDPRWWSKPFGRPVLSSDINWQEPKN